MAKGTNASDGPSGIALKRVPYDRLPNLFRSKGRPYMNAEARNVQRRSLALFSIMLALIAAGCDQHPDNAQTQPPVQTAAAPKNTARIKLDPGCPLGTTGLTGIAIIENVCKVSGTTTPRGPVGTPMP
jgi:hypothetical protein